MNICIFFCTWLAITCLSEAVYYLLFREDDRVQDITTIIWIAIAAIPFAVLLLLYYGLVQRFNKKQPLLPVRSERKQPTEKTKLLYPRSSVKLDILTDCMICLTPLGVTNIMIKNCEFGGNHLVHETCYTKFKVVYPNAKCIVCR